MTTITSDHIYNRIAAELGGVSFDATAAACERAHKDGICIQTYAIAAKAAAMLTALGYVKGE